METITWMKWIFSIFNSYRICNHNFVNYNVSNRNNTTVVCLNKHSTALVLMYPCLWTLNLLILVWALLNVNPKKRLIRTHWIYNKLFSFFYRTGSILLLMDTPLQRYYQLNELIWFIKNFSKIVRVSIWQL